jgi:hypothetical protein
MRLGRLYKMEDKIKIITELIRQSELDQTIKDILIRDLQAEGLTDFLREQIKSYCLEGIKRATGQIERAQQILDNHIDQDTQNPGA